jgi:hypothetical protein
MSDQLIRTDDILLAESRFALGDVLFETEHEQFCYIHSFGSLGILFPVVVQKDDSNRIHLADGRKRIKYAKRNGIESIRATVLPRNTPVTDIITLILCNRRFEIESSVINKIEFLYFVASLNVPESWILKSLCTPFEFKPYAGFLRECERIHNLPKMLKQFCHEKKFSFKQLLNMTYHPTGLLNQVMEWKKDLQLTASTMEEIASNLREFLKGSNKTLEELLSDPEVGEIFDSSLSPRDKTDRLRRFIRLKRFPILSDINARIQDTVSALDIPKEIKFDWDRTLENKRLDLTVNINDPEKWQRIVGTLQSNEIKNAVQSILDEL